MIKKLINQNDKIKLDLIDTFEPDFIFNDKPLNRFKINNSNNANNSNNSYPTSPESGSGVPGKFKNSDN